MRSHWQRGRNEGELEAVLRALRSDPEAGYVQELVQRANRKPARAHVGSRLAFAGAVSTVILGMFASFGGFGYAASGVSGTYTVVKNAVTDHQLSVNVHKSSAQAQYGKPKEEAPATASRGAQQQELGVAGASNALPFTGVSLGLTVVVGFALIIVGMMLRRRENAR